MIITNSRLKLLITAVLLSLGLLLIMFSIVSTAGEILEKQTGSLFEISNISAITDDTNRFSDPNWSPNGKKISFAASANSGVWVIDSDGKNLRNLTKEAWSGWRHIWISNSVIVFHCRYPYGKSAQSYLKSVNVNSGKIESLLKSKSLTPPILTSKGNVFTKNRELKRNYFIDEDGKANKAKKEEFVFYLDNNLRLLMFNPDGAESKYISQDEKMVDYFEVSPEGTSIIYSSMETIFIYNIANGTKTKLGIGSRPSWSPDGKYIVYTVIYEKSNGEDNSDIFVMKVDGSEKTQLTSTIDEVEYSPRWSPVGNKITFYSGVTGKIYTADIKKHR